MVSLLTQCGSEAADRHRAMVQVHYIQRDYILYSVIKAVIRKQKTNGGKQKEEGGALKGKGGSHLGGGGAFASRFEEDTCTLLTYNIIIWA